MTRRGQCRCGAVLEFKETSRGFKTRCTQCGAIVRLRIDQSMPVPRPHAPSRVPAPLPDKAPQESENFLLDSTETPDFSVLFEQASSAPRAQTEIEAYREPPARGIKPWIWVAGAVFLLLLVGASAAVLLQS